VSCCNYDRRRGAMWSLLSVIFIDFAAAAKLGQSWAERRAQRSSWRRSGRSRGYCRHKDRPSERYSASCKKTDDRKFCGSFRFGSGSGFRCCGGRSVSAATLAPVGPSPVAASRPFVYLLILWVTMTAVADVIRLCWLDYLEHSD